MIWEAWLTLAVVTLAVLVLTRDLVSPAVAFMAAVVVLLIADVVTPGEAFQGFSNPAPITVAALYVLARAVEKSGALQPMVRATLGTARSVRGALARMTVPVAAASAFLNNTPIIAMLSPQIGEWADRRGDSASRYLMPLSFAAILGGMTTLIGTSTNLVVSGLLEEQGYDPFTMFELTRVALPLALVGLVVTVLVSPNLLPDRLPPRQEAREGGRSFSVRMIVEPGGPLDGLRMDEAWSVLPEGATMVYFERDGEGAGQPHPETVLKGGDFLTLLGDTDVVLNLHDISGLASSQQPHLPFEFRSARHSYFEAVIAPESRLVGQSLIDIRFLARYQATVVAIHRAGEPVHGHLAQAQLKPGDTLMVIADQGFGERWRGRNDFMLVSRLGAPAPPLSPNAVVVLAVAAAVVVGAGLQILPILHLSLLGALALVVLGILTPNEAKDSIDFDVIVVIGAAFGLAAAVESSGLGQSAADLIAAVSGNFGAQGAMAAIVVSTIALSSIITNNAAAALVLPIALTSAGTFGIDARAAAVAVALSASASFMTPIAYQTNLMVYGPGGYHFGDYARLGTPLTLVVAVGLVWSTLG
ncbi:MAG: SLC13 family permease [Gemmatimonadetes bacterium]|nr:SLC13 family permease [Gemmatimonadota bacterium]MYC00054.1 SLC13 family permease [Gemmatimonadota bacterium]MYH53053.1 SLC13 family permease [Gemmatimonadota bacterium]MYI46456.1 SLC13 family permease [Gemmatimonadota bacterium]MYK66169.1 SLC13 family permease [Gemmatimonadota bacterium]